MLKLCSKCGERKSGDLFSKDRRRSDGLCRLCKACRRQVYEDTKTVVQSQSRQHYERNRERHGELSRAHYRANKQHRSSKMAEWYRKNADRVRQSVADYRASHPGFDAAKQAKRRARERRATPPWVSMKEIAVFYAEADRLTLTTGVKHHVDHVFPLSHPELCGLHVPANLQVLTASENVAKSNKLPGA